MSKKPSEIVKKELDKVEATLTTEEPSYEKRQSTFKRTVTEDRWLGKDLVRAIERAELRDLFRKWGVGEQGIWVIRQLCLIGAMGCTWALVETIIMVIKAIF